MAVAGQSFIKSSLERIGQECPRRNSQVQKKVEAILKVFADLVPKTHDSTRSLFPYKDSINIKDDKGVLCSRVNSQWNTLANLLVEILVCACEAKLHVLFEVSLDCFQKLVTYEFLHRDTPDFANQGKPLMELVTKTILAGLSFTDGKEGEAVSLQMVKALTASVSLVEGPLLIQSIEAVMKIYVTGSPINSSMAEGMLSHTMDVVFSRPDWNDSEKKPKKSTEDVKERDPPQSLVDVKETSGSEKKTDSKKENKRKRRTER